MTKTTGELDAEIERLKQDNEEQPATDFTNSYARALDAINELTKEVRDYKAFVAAFDKWRKFECETDFDVDLDMFDESDRLLEEVMKARAAMES